MFLDQNICAVKKNLSIQTLSTTLHWILYLKHYFLNSKLTLLILYDADIWYVWHLAYGC